MTYEIALNIIGGEWVIIIFVALVLILGTNKLPEAAKKMGKAVNEYNRAKTDVRESLNDVGIHETGVRGPVNTERQKLEIICKTLGIDFNDKSNDELRTAIESKMGKKDS
ncbi:MAG: sec-independent translocation protein (mttA/Hcf106, tatA) [Cenarchaeum symbiont of Oopsacas minuta]|nr:sec-independent translocation protein (mttA/Hcf106, tatA) [Cenarchaeum symbiont of Oopsacas minuta]